MDSSDQSNEVPNPDGRPPVNSVEFIRAFRSLVEDDPRWERDEASRRARDYWREILLEDHEQLTLTYTDDLSRDADIADTWFNRFFIEDTAFDLDNREAWNHPIFQEFLGRWWHPGTRLPVLAPEDAVSRTATTPPTSDAAGTGAEFTEDPTTGEVAGSEAEHVGGRTATNLPDPPAPLSPESENEAQTPGSQGGSGTARQSAGPPPTPGGPPQNTYPTPFSGPRVDRSNRDRFPESPSRVRRRATRDPAQPHNRPPPGDLPQQLTGEIRQPRQPNLPDMQRPHTWRDQRQPPIGARLLQILNWLYDEDIDRRRDWARELNEAEAWVQEQLDQRDENGLGDDTITLLRQAEAAIKTHRRNERYHYRTFMDLKIPNPDELPKYAPRLPYNSRSPIELGVAGPKSKTTEILPQFPDVPRPWREVNSMWLTEQEAALNFDPPLHEAREGRLLALARSEEKLWAPRAGQPPQTPDNNSLLAENSSYLWAIDETNGDAFTRGWVYWRDGHVEPEEARILSDGTQLLNTYTDFALERGARRAGLQTALRQFHSSENHMIANNGRMLVLPGGTRAETFPDLEEVKTKAGIGNSRPVPLTELPANQMQRIDGKTDPQGFNANMAQYWRKAHEVMPAARKHAIDRAFRRSPDGPFYAHPRDENRPLPPKSLFGPFVWRGVTAKVQLRQDCLRQMRGLKKLFDREKRIAPRQLLADMDTAYQRGYGLEEAPRELLQLVDGRDRVTGALLDNDPDIDQKPRYLNHVELEWIRFLLSHSMTEGMTSAALPRTAIFLNFAQRLERIFNDPGDDLFPDKETSVSIEDLIAHMAKMKGPVKKTTFYVYDVKMFLERLAFQGRCRYVEDWRTYGRVKRPVPKYFPENLIIWRPRDDDSADPDNFPEDMRPETPRFEDLHTWHDIVHQDPPETLHREVRNFILCLAYRWGHGTRRLETQEEQWKTAQPLPLPMVNTTIGRLSNRFELHMGNGQDRAEARPVADDMTILWRKTLNKGEEHPPEGTTAIKEIRKAVLHEIVRADNMLYPGRSTNYFQADAPKTREPIWDWAKQEVRGNSKKFFSLNRWPVQLQSAETQQRITDDVDVDPDFLWNPIIEDPTPWTYYRPKARPYGADRDRFRTGDRHFPIGDSARQREVVKNQVMAMVGSAMGITPDDSTADDGVFSKLKGLLGFGKKRPRALVDNPDDDDDHGVAHRHKLPRVEPSLAPSSVDVVAEAEAAMRAHEDATRLDVLPADQVPADAQDVRFIDRSVSGRDNALVVEQNLPL